MQVKEILRSHPRGGADDALIACIEECFACAQACTACADACLDEETVAKLVRCIRLDLDCSDVSAATGNILSRQTETNSGLVQTMLNACAEACRRCAEECEQHAEHHEHCAVCAEACRSCEQACQNALTTVSV